MEEYFESMKEKRLEYLLPVDVLISRRIGFRLICGYNLMDQDDKEEKVEDDVVLFFKS